MEDNLYTHLFNVIQGAFWAYGYILIAVAIISWLPDLSETQFGRALRRITDPYLRWFRRFIPSVTLGGVVLDLSYAVGVLVYFVIQQVVLSVLFVLVRGPVG